MDLNTTLNAFALVVVANSAPWLASQLLSNRGDYPLDCNLRWRDGVRLLGDHKTWRGIITATLGCALAGMALDHDMQLGMMFGLLAMLGDAVSSAIKRRLRLPPGTDVFGLDHLPEALLPLTVLADQLHVNALEIVTIAAVFMMLDAMTTRLRQQT